MNTRSYASGIEKRFCVSLLALLLACLVAGCDQNNQNKMQLQQAVKKYAAATTLEGAVSDNQGPVKAGMIKVTDSKGQLIASSVLANSEHYRVEIPANTVLPIVLTFHPQANQAKAEEYITAVVHPNVTQYDINPLSTAIAKKAMALGGYTHANLVMAAESMGTVPDANKTTAGFRGDPTKQYGGWH